MPAMTEFLTASITLGTLATALMDIFCLVRERVYGPGELAAATQFIANPHLFADATAVRAAMAAWPLQPTHLINGGD